MNIAKKVAPVVLFIAGYLFGIALMLSGPSARHDANLPGGGAPDLTDDYNRLNFEYFKASLPPVTIQRIDDKEMPWLGYTIQCGPRCFQISINSAWAPAQVSQEETLIHEMCHVKLYVDGSSELQAHGPAWQSCMLERAKRGALKFLW